MDIEDTDGWGPENISLAEPQDGHTYRIGVHYWNDHTLGYSVATVRVFVGGVLKYESPPVSLDSQDLWQVATIDWPSGVITPLLDAAGQPDVTPGFASPLFAP